MKSRKSLVLALLGMMTLLTAGCGDKLYTLTPEQESSIVAYSARVVAKHNKAQPDGQVAIPEATTEAPLEAGPAASEMGNTEMAPTMDASSEQPAQADVKPSEASGNLEQSPAGESLASPSEAGGTTMALNDALGLTGVSAQIKGSELVPAYEEDGNSAMTPESGNQILVLHVDLTEKTGQSQYLDILSKKPVFEVTVNGNVTEVSYPTILRDDLSTYQGNLDADATMETVLLFQVPDSVTQVDSLQLSLTLMGQKTQISM